MSDLDRLVDVAQDLGPAGLAEVIDLAERLRRREAEEGEAHVRALLADPLKREKLYASLREADDSIDRGEGVDGESFFKDLLNGLPE
ncbi:MAG TPA: hypothetical protein V6D47_10005 [Oscillatoriaceae cyanobacterium]